MAGGADRLGALPDELLHHVLSFLRAHEVVSTSLLSRRWRNLWKTAPVLRVTGVKRCDDSPWFIRFVDHLLLLRDPSATLDSFQLDLDERDFEFDVKLFPYYARSVSVWFRLALLCQARVLSLRTTAGLCDYDDSGAPLPEDPPLELLNVPIISQHLRRLDLEFVTVSSSTLDFSGCPSLIGLNLRSCRILGSISSPFMKHLSITRSYFAVHSLRSRIRLPSLVSLVLTDFGTRIPLLEDMPLLVSATVRVTQRWYDECPNNIYGGCVDPTCPAGYISDDGADEAPGESVLLKGLSNVQNLDISVHSQVFIVNRDLKLCLTFHKLKTLLLSEWCPGVAADLNLLTYFLQYSPVLEKLTVQLSKVPKKQVETERSHEQLQRSFTCSHLKIVEIKCEEDDERLQELFDMLAAYDIPLEKINIQQTDGASEP